MKVAGSFAVTAAVVGSLAPSAVLAGFRSPQSLVQNLYAYYGDGSPDYSRGLPRDEATARLFFRPNLALAWLDPSPRPFDFLVQATSWKIGSVAITGTIKQFDKTYVRVAFMNRDKPVALNIVIVNGDDGWVIADVESTHDSLASFLARLKNRQQSP